MFHGDEQRLLREIIEELQHIRRDVHSSLNVLYDQRTLIQGISSNVRSILILIKPKQLTHSIVVRFTGASMQPNNTCVFNVGDTAPVNILALLADGITPSGGTISNAAYNFNDPSATVVLNPDGLTAVATGVADSGGVAVKGTATCTVTDTDGVVSQWIQDFTITTKGVAPPQQLTQSIAVQFGDPVTPTGGSNVPSLSAGIAVNPHTGVAVGERAPAAKK